MVIFFSKILTPFFIFLKVQKNLGLFFFKRSRTKTQFLQTFLKAYSVFGPLTISDGLIMIQKNQLISSIIAHD